MKKVMIFLNTVLSGTYYGELEFVDYPQKGDRIAIAGLTFIVKKREHHFNPRCNVSAGMEVSAILDIQKELADPEQLETVMFHYSLKRVQEIHIG